MGWYEKRAIALGLENRKEIRKMGKVDMDRQNPPKGRGGKDATMHSTKTL